MLPVLLVNDDDKFNLGNFEKIKIRARKALSENQIHWFDFEFDDVSIKILKKDLVNQMAPLLLKVKNNKKLSTKKFDIKVLLKILLTPYLTSFYFKA